MGTVNEHSPLIILLPNITKLCHDTIENCPKHDKTLNKNHQTIKAKLQCVLSANTNLIVMRVICLPNFPIAAAAAEPTMPPPAMTTSACELVEEEEDIITREEAVWRGGARVS